MRTKICLIALLSLMQISCPDINEKPLGIVDEVPVFTPTPAKINNPIAVEPRKNEKMVIYWSALSWIWADFEHENLFEIKERYHYLVYRIEAVSPEGLEQIENNPAVPKSLIENFRTAIQKPGRLLDSYPVKQPILGYSGSRDMAKFYAEAKRKNPKTRDVVCFSNIGIDDSYTVTMVYGEYYRPDKGLFKFYLLMKMDLLQEKIHGDSFSGVEDFDFLFVN